MNIKNRILVFSALAAVFLSQCNYREDKVGMTEVRKGPGGPEPTSIPVITATYSSISSLVLKGKCMTCHTGAAAKKDVDLSDYDTMMALDPPVVVPFHPEESDLYLDLSSGKMPPKNKLDEAIVKAVYEWILNGAKND